MQDKAKPYDAERKSLGTIADISARPQPGIGIGSLPCFSLPALSAQPPTLGILALIVDECPAHSDELLKNGEIAARANPEAIHPLLADLRRFDECGHPATLH